MKHKYDTDEYRHEHVRTCRECGNEYLDDAEARYTPWGAPAPYIRPEPCPHCHSTNTTRKESR